MNDISNFRLWVIMVVFARTLAEGASCYQDWLHWPNNLFLESQARYRYILSFPISLFYFSTFDLLIFLRFNRNLFKWPREVGLQIGNLGNMDLKWQRAKLQNKSDKTCKRWTNYGRDEIYTQLCTARWFPVPYCPCSRSSQEGFPGDFHSVVTTVAEKVCFVSTHFLMTWT